MTKFKLAILGVFLTFGFSKSSYAEVIKCYRAGTETSVLELIIYKTPTKACMDRGSCPFVGVYSPNSFFLDHSFNGHMKEYYSFNEDQLLDNAYFSKLDSKGSISVQGNTLYVDHFLIKEEIEIDCAKL